MRPARSGTVVSRRTGLQIREHHENPPVPVGIVDQAKLLEHLGDVGLDRTFGDEQPCGDRLVGQPLGDEGEDFSLTVGEPVKRIRLPASADQPRHDRRVDDTFAVAQATQGISQDRDVEHPLLEQVADAFMRTTITLEPDVEALVRKAMRDRDKETVNQALRKALTTGTGAKPYRTRTLHMGAPRVPLDRALQVAADLEDDELMRKFDLRN
jgi:hypothetical protein